MATEPAQAPPIQLPPERVIARLEARIGAEVSRSEQLQVAVDLLVERLTSAASYTADLEAEIESLKNPEPADPLPGIDD